ncbi:hypothetical protein Tco_1564426 [Tanacetum coccineum]
MQAQKPVGTTQYLSGLTRETNIDDRHGSNILFPLFDQEDNQTMDDPTIQKKKQYDKNRYQRRKENTTGENDNMKARTIEGTSQTVSAFTRETNIDDRTVNNLLLTLFDQELDQTMTGTKVGEDPTIQKTRKYNKSYYQRRKEHDNFQGNSYDFVYNGLPNEHSLLKEQPSCVHCRAKKMQYEFPTFCCIKGKTTLQPLDISPKLYNLFTSQCQLGKMFRKNIRAYNTNFSFASMGVNLDKIYNARGSGVYTFRVQGGIYHKIDQLVPRDGEPRYLQLYFYDVESDFEHKLKWPNLDREIITILSRVLAPNPYVRTFRSLGNLGPLNKYRVELTESVKVDQILYNRLTTFEVASIWVEGNENITIYKKSIVVYGRSEYPTQIQPYFASYDPLSYPMFFLNGEAGWHSRIAREGVEIRELDDAHDDVAEDEEGSKPINRGLIQAIPTSLPPQPIGEATKASNLRRIPPGVQGRSHFTYFLYLIVQIRIL